MALSTASRPDVRDQILSLLTRESTLTARQISDALGISKVAVNRVLHGSLKTKLVQDSSYRWSLAGAGVAAHTPAAERAAPRTELGRLCRYYLECISWDTEDGISAFASGRFDLDYVELEKCPFLDGATDPLDGDPARELIRRARRDRTRVLHVGYPVRLRHQRGKSGWEGFFVDPVLLFDLADDGLMADAPPQLNFAVLKSLPRTGSGHLIDEAIELANELGLASPAAELPDSEDLVLRLRRVRADWDWREEIDPYQLSGGQTLAQIHQAGIYNRAVLIASERSPYSLGLETELDRLARIDEDELRGTALADWLSQAASAEVGAEIPSLLEPLPLNSEQRHAVRRALRNPLTVITGPPGTGKSQLVSCLLINAAWQGKRALFSSKNNKAVDVVDTRVNALGPRPALLRVGRAEYQDRLAEYLSALLASTSDASDETRYCHHLGIHEALRFRDGELEDELDQTIRIRNEVDGLEQGAELARQSLGRARFTSLDSSTLRDWARAIQLFREAAAAASRRDQPFLVRIFWPLFRGARLSRLRHVCAEVDRVAQSLGSALPLATLNDAAIPLYTEAGQRLAHVIALAEDAVRYRERLAELQRCRRPEAIAAERMRLVGDISTNSERLWRLWLQLQPSKLKAEQRASLGRYVAVLKMINRTNEGDQRVGREVFREYHRLFPQVADCLPCWAVTSLSARGKLPFTPGFFDLVVIDEASQCDIASALPLLFRAKRAVIIGDPKQLKHLSAVTPRQDSLLLEEHGLVQNRTNWAYAANSLFDLASGIACAEDIVQLRDHHRSHAAIIRFSNDEFYEGRLRVATRYDRLRRVRSNRELEPAIRWVDVAGEVRRPAPGGALNDAEAAAVVNELRRVVLTCRYQGTIGVVSPFRAQAYRVRDLVNAKSELASRLDTLEFLAATVHSFQGDERDLILFSPVVSNGTPDGALTFLRRHANLFNVAITRARAALVVIGDRAAAERSGVDYLARFARYAAGINTGDEAIAATATPDLGPTYPAVAHPDYVSDWKRILYSALHEAGLRTIPQYNVEHYAIDLALLQRERKLAIEVDGERYHRAWDGELCRRDQLRNMRLIELGWDVMRFWVYEVRDDLRGVVERIGQWNNAGLP